MRSVVRSLALVVLVAASGGCAWYRTHFPARDEVFKPIPVEVGERRVSGRDTTFAVGGEGFELMVPDPELLPDAKRALDYAAREYVRMFGSAPPPVVIQVAWRADARGGRLRVDSVVRRPDGRRALTVTVPPLPRDRGQREQRLRFARPLVSIAGLVAHAWISGRADGAPPRLAAVSAPEPSSDAWTLRDDPRVPDWMEEGAAVLIGAPQRQDVLDALLVRDRHALPSLGELFAMARPGAPRDARAGDPIAYGTDARGERMTGSEPDDDPSLPGASRGRGGARMRSAPPRVAFGPAERFSSQAHSVVRFLARREGLPFVGVVLDRLVDGVPIERALAGGRTMPALAGDPSRVDVAMLDRQWRTWLAERVDERGPGPR